MRGSFTRRSPSSVRLKAYGGTDPITKQEIRHYKTVRAETDDEAEEQLILWLADLIKSGKYQATPTQGRKFLDLANRWFARQDVEPGTLLTERSIIDVPLRGLHDVDVRVVNDADYMTNYYRALRDHGGACRRKPQVGRTVIAMRAYRDAADRGTIGLTDDELATTLGMAADAKFAEMFGEPAGRVFNRKEIAGWRPRVLGDMVERSGETRSGGYRPVQVFRISDRGREWLADRERCIADECDHRAPLSPEYLKRVHGVMGRIFDYAVQIQFGGIFTNRVRDAKPGKVYKKRPKTPTRREVIELLSAAEELDPELYLYCFMDAETGARRGELAVLRLSDFTNEGVRIERSLSVGMDTPDVRRRFSDHSECGAWCTGVAHFWLPRNRRGQHPTLMVEKATKNDDSERTNRLSARTLGLVAEQAERLVAVAREASMVYPGNGFLFPGSIDGTRPLRVDTWNDRWGRVRTEAGLEHVKLHGLRHFVVTQIRKEFGSFIAGAHVGHSGRSKTTDAIYGTFEVDEEAVVADFMADILTAKPASAGRNVVPMRRRR